MPKPFWLSPAFSASGGYGALNHIFLLQMRTDVSHTQPNSFDSAAVCWGVTAA
jgi:hypothetical protein